MPDLTRWLQEQRWFAGKSRQIAAIRDYAQLPLGRVIQVEYAGGSIDLYQLVDAEDASIQRALFQAVRPGEEPPPGRVLNAEQSNTSIAYGEDWILKLYRRLSHGLSRDLEIGRFLTAAGFPHTPAVAGSLEHDDITLAVMQRFVPNQGDCWTYVLEGLNSGRDLLLDIERLGEITGELHGALASRPDNPDFAPTAATEHDEHSWLADLRHQFETALVSAPPDVAAQLESWRSRLDQLRPPAEIPELIQVHGDYHLGQVLKTPDDFVVIDFEGEPARPLAERRAKQPPIRDVAGMLRSLHYASVTAGAGAWHQPAGDRFLAGWRRGSSNRFASTPELLTLFQVSKALYELNYELNNRPAWVQVPLAGIQQLLG
jgi:maltose alpha-D-glucosyltransferase/alpha-amylase